ncbi:MAG: amidase family protein [Phormidesmis sp.]
MSNRLKQAAVSALVAPAALFSITAESAIAAAFKLEEATITSINKAFDADALSAEELVQLYLNRIATYDDAGPVLNSVLSINPKALQTAKALDIERQTAGPRSPLHGIPILLKDNHDTFDIPTTGGSDALVGSLPPNDAYVVDRFRDAGAIILGKAEMDEFAISGSGYSSIGGATLNPYNFNRSTGGSSGGTGAAIAANFAVFGTGSDTGGSIRTPCSFQALACIRPTRGLVSLDGIIPFVLSRDMIGPMARNLTDAAIALGTMADYDPDNPSFDTPIAAPEVQLDKFYTDYTQFLDPTGLDGARIGVLRNFIGIENGIDPEITQITENALDVMRGLGATAVDVLFEEDFLATTRSLYSTAIPVEQKAYLEDYLATLDPEYPKTIDGLISILSSPEIAESETPSIVLGTLGRSAESPGFSDPEYLDVANVLTPFVRGKLIDTLDSLDLDAFVFPTLNTFARPLIGTTDPTFESFPGSPPTRPVELSSSAGLPDITIPAGFGSTDLPVTLSFTGRPYDEETLLGLAYAFEQATMVRRPPSLLPPLAGEVIQYESVPEPSALPALVVLGTALVGIRVIRRDRQTLLTLLTPKGS